MTNRASHRDALMLVDFQRDFLADEGRMPVARSHVADLVSTTCAAITRARDEGELIVKVGNEFKHHHFIGNALRHNAALAGSPGADWDPRIDATDAIYLPKWKKDAFCNPQLQQVLVDHQITRITLTGLFAEACISSTARGALARGYDVQVITNAVACRSDRSRSAAITKLSKDGVRLINNGERSGGPV
jgi:nicotinamidase-related amidase